MKNKILLSLAIISCLAFTACGTNETVADSTSASENIVSENSVSESTVSESSVSESTVAESDTIEPESSQQGTISGYEAPTDETGTEEENINDIGLEIYDETEETETEEETEVVEEETTESSDEQLVSSLNLPEDERQFYMQQFGLSSDELDNLTVTRLYELIDGYLNSLMDGGGSSSGGGSSTGGSSDNSGSNGGDEGNHESNPWGLPVGQLNPGDGSLPGGM